MLCFWCVYCRIDAVSRTVVPDSAALTEIVAHTIQIQRPQCSMNNLCEEMALLTSPPSECKPARFIPTVVFIVKIRVWRLSLAFNFITYLAESRGQSTLLLVNSYCLQDQKQAGSSLKDPRWRCFNSTFMIRSKFSSLFNNAYWLYHREYLVLQWFLPGVVPSRSSFCVYSSCPYLLNYDDTTTGMKKNYEKIISSVAGVAGCCMICQIFPTGRS